MSSASIFRRQVSLQPFNTLAVDAKAEYFTEVFDRDELQLALSEFHTLNQNAEKKPLLILGGGSNLILSDDFRGFVIKVSITGIDVLSDQGEEITLRVGAGENWHQLVNYTVDKNWFGLENLALIPGSVGAAPVQNIGAYGAELQDAFVELTAVEISTGKEKIFTKEDCCFGYRESVFKQRLMDQYVIVSVTLTLSKSSSPNIDYPALKHALSGSDLDGLTPKQVFDAVCRVRSSKLPDPNDIPNVGSFFKNPVVCATVYERIQQEHPDVVGFVQEQDQVKLAAGWLIDQAGWKGRAMGAAKVHEHQALVLTNPGRGSGEEVLKLARAIQDDISRRYGVALEMEPRVY